MRASVYRRISSIGAILGNNNSSVAVDDDDDVEAPRNESKLASSSKSMSGKVVGWMGLSKGSGDYVSRKYDEKYTFWLTFKDKVDEEEFVASGKNQIYPPVFWAFLILVGGIDMSRLSLSRMFKLGIWMKVTCSISVASLIVFFIFAVSHFSRLTGIRETFWFEKICRAVGRYLFRDRTEDVITILFSLAFCSFLVARVVEGPCSEDGRATAAIDCNPEHIAKSPPTDTVIAAYIHPLALQMSIKGITKHAMVFAWTIATATVTWAVVYYEGWLSIYSILQSLFFLLVIYETQRLKMLVFLQTKYELEMEKKRREKLELENMLRREIQEQNRLMRTAKELEEGTRQRRLEELPVHSMILRYYGQDHYKQPAFLQHQHRDELLALIKSNIASAKQQDFDGKTALTLLLNTGVAEVDLVTLLLINSLPINPFTEEFLDPNEHDYAWTKVVQYERYEPCVKHVLALYPVIGPELAKVEDPEGRAAVHIASPKCKKAILSCIYFYRRYEIITLEQPHYQTMTSLVHLAIDHDSEEMNKVSG